MKHIIEAVKQKLAAWRQHREDQQSLIGYRWARMAYYEEGRSLEWIEERGVEFGGTVGPFERGVQQATHEIHKFEEVLVRIERFERRLNDEVNVPTNQLRRYVQLKPEDLHDGPARNRQGF